MLLRRRLDPTNKQIRELLAWESAGGDVNTSETVATVDGDRFTLQGEGAEDRRGTGVLTGPPWKWSSWTSSSILHLEEDREGLRLESVGVFTDTGLDLEIVGRSEGFYAKFSAVLHTFDCRTWDAVHDGLGVFPPLASGGCARACRHRITKEFWQTHGGELDAAEDHEAAEVRSRFDRGLSAAREAALETCVGECIRANEPKRTECVAHASSIERMKRCR